MLLIRANVAKQELLGPSEAGVATELHAWGTTPGYICHVTYYMLLPRRHVAPQW